jgi:hypothetical protein
MEILRNKNVILGVLTAGSLLLAGCSVAKGSRKVDASSTPTPTSSPVGPDYQATIDALNVQLATQTEMPTVVIEAPKKVIEEQVWHQDTNMDGYQASPIGGLETTRPMIVETWGPTLEGNRGFVVIVPAGSVMWLQRHYGGTGAWVNQLPEGMTVEDLASEHADNILARDGTRPEVVDLPGTAENWPEGGFPLLGCLQTKPVENGVRRCDSVGGLPGYDAPAAEPVAGYFRGYGN